MGVYIKGIEMPESCLECPFKWAGDGTTYCLAQTPTMKSLIPVKLHEIRWKKFRNAVEKFRWKEASCPLVPVPPHGRLIDADALIKELTLDDEDDNNGASLLMAIFLEVLKAAPTIIPAEEVNK